MVRTIYKYPLEVSKNTLLKLPKGAEILTCQIDERIGKIGHPCIWAIVDKEEKVIEERTFLLFGTGHDLPEKESGELKYINTFQLQESTFIFHLFELC